MFIEATESIYDTIYASDKLVSFYVTRINEF